MSGMGRGLSRDVMTRRTRGHRTHGSQLTRWHYQSPAAAALHHSARVSLTSSLRDWWESQNSSSMYTSKTNPRVYGMKAFYVIQYYSMSLWAYLLSEYQLSIYTNLIEAINKSLHLAYSFFVTNLFNAKFDKSCNNVPVYQKLVDWFFKGRQIGFKVIAKNVYIFVWTIIQYQVLCWGFY